MLYKKESSFFKFKISYLASTGANVILLSTAAILAFRYIVNACSIASPYYWRKHVHLDESLLQYLQF